MFKKQFFRCVFLGGNMKFISGLSFMVLACCGFGWSQIVYQPTIRIPVTFYDFHADGSNPDFEPGIHTCGTYGCLTNNGLKINEVGTTLTPLRKPIVGSTPFFSQRVQSKWFTPWQTGDNTIPAYSLTGAYLHDSSLTTDTSYKNVVIQDTLTFTLIPGSAGVYQYRNSAFFMLDGRGFGADDPGGQNPPHNYSFTMELHWELTYQSGLTLDFESNDDMWVFVNGQRVVDLGGLHGPTPATVNLDNTPVGMTVGQRYMLDLFYAQRHVTGCDILITVNIISAQPARRPPSIYPKFDTLAAGSFVPLWATFFVDTGILPRESDSQILWTLSPAGTASELSGATGAVDTFFACQAYTTYIIGTSYTDRSSSPTTVWTFSDTVYVKPGPDYRVWIEPDANINPNGTMPQMLARLRSSDRVSLVQLLPSQTQDTVYGVARDLYGNFTRLASNALWTEVPVIKSMVQVTNGTPPYVGLIDRTIADSGTTMVRVSVKDLSTGVDLESDTTLVILQSSSSLERLPIVKAFDKTKPICEFYNLRGQKLQAFGNSRIDGIVLERVIGPGSMSSVKRLFRGHDSR